MLLLQVCIRISFHLLIAHFGWQVVFSASLLDEALVCFLVAHIAFHLHEQLITHTVQWLDTAFLV